MYGGSWMLDGGYEPTYDTTFWECFWDFQGVNRHGAMVLVHHKLGHGDRNRLEKPKILVSYSQDFPSSLILDATLGSYSHFPDFPYLEVSQNEGTPSYHPFLDRIVHSKRFQTIQLAMGYPHGELETRHCPVTAAPLFFCPATDHGIFHSLPKVWVLVGHVQFGNRPAWQRPLLVSPRDGAGAEFLRADVRWFSCSNSKGLESSKPMLDGQILVKWRNHNRSCSTCSCFNLIFWYLDPPFLLR